MDNEILGKQTHFVRIIHNPVTAWLVLATSLALTVAAYFIAESFVSERAQDRFAFRSSEIENAIKDRLGLYEQVLWGGVGLLNASGFKLNREQFANYVDTLNINRYWPGIQGIGFSVPVAVNEKASHIAAIRAEGFPNYDITPAGNRDYYTAIIFLEPFDWRNQRAFGYDMWSNDVRRRAMMQARDEGSAAKSGIITLVQETEDDVQPGFLIYLPVYKTQTIPATLELRREAFVGWIYAPFRVRDLMEGILGSEDANIVFQIYDGEQSDLKSLLYESGQTDSMLTKKAVFSKTSLINLDGRPWTIQFKTTSGYIPVSEQNQPFYVALAGGVVDALLFYVIYALYSINKRYEFLTRERRLIIEHAPNAFIMTDPAGTILLTNNQADILFGYRNDELIGKSVEILVPDKFRDAHPTLRESFLQQPKARAMGAGRDLTGIRKDGTEVPVEIGLNPISTSHGNYILASVVDITERKNTQLKLEKVNSQLKSKNQEMEQFIYTVSHDLKSPLVTIGGFTKKLSDTLNKKIDEKQQHQLQRITANVNHMEGLLNDLLQLSRVIRQGIEPVEIDTKKLVKDVFYTLESEISSSQASIVLHEPLLPIFGNQRLAFQCMQNLISNAIQYRDKNRLLKITISTTAKNNCIALNVQDNGIGIAEKYHNLIFNIFERLDVGEGTGVGLAIVKTIMEKHSGKIELESEPGRGSTFSLYFPHQMS